MEVNDQIITLVNAYVTNLDYFDQNPRTKSYITLSPKSSNIPMQLKYLLILVLSFISNISIGQLYQVDLNEKVANSRDIIEGKVISQKSFWNPAHTMIYTTNTVHVYKSFKGNYSA